MTAIRNGRMVQFAPPIQILGSQLALGAQIAIQLPALLSALWMPPTYVVAGQVVANPATQIIGVRINLESAPMLPWGLQGNNISSFSGPVERIFVELLQGAGSDVVLMGARGIGIGYSDALTAAGTPSSSPSILGNPYIH